MLIYSEFRATCEKKNLQKTELTLSVRRPGVPAQILKQILLPFPLVQKKTQNFPSGDKRVSAATNSCRTRVTKKSRRQQSSRPAPRIKRVTQSRTLLLLLVCGGFNRGPGSRSHVIFLLDD